MGLQAATQAWNALFSLTRQFSIHLADLFSFTDDPAIKCAAETKQWLILGIAYIWHKAILQEYTHKIIEFTAQLRNKESNQIAQVGKMVREVGQSLPSPPELRRPPRPEPL